MNRQASLWDERARCQQRAPSRFPLGGALVRLAAHNEGGEGPLPLSVGLVLDLGAIYSRQFFAGHGLSGVGVLGGVRCLGRE